VDALDVAPGRRQHPRHAVQPGGGDRIADHRDRQLHGGRRRLVGRHRPHRERHRPLGRDLVQRLHHARVGRRAAGRQPHQQAQRELTAHHDLLEIEHLAAGRHQHAGQRRGDAALIAAGDGEQQRRREHARMFRAPALARKTGRRP
jgi:hypothetical protein